MDMEDRLASLREPVYLTTDGLRDLYSDLSNPQDKIKNLVKKGELRRVRRDLYLLGSMYRRGFSRQVLANLIYGPSAVSFESALSFHNVIPERVEMVKSICFKRNRQFSTPFGLFTYKYISPEIFHIGLDHVENVDGNFFMASAEKALCDIAYFRRIESAEQAVVFLEEDLRADIAILRNLDFGKLLELKRAYKRKSVVNVFDGLISIKERRF